LIHYSVIASHHSGDQQFWNSIPLAGTCIRHKGTTYSIIILEIMQEVGYVDDFEKQKEYNKYNHNSSFIILKQSIPCIEMKKSNYSMSKHIYDEA
jgi:ribosomal protein S8